MSAFDKYLHSLSLRSNAQSLPLFHVSSVRSAEYIVQNRKITPAICPYFNQRISYLFYGRCAYRPKGGQDILDTNITLPAAFIVRNSVIGQSDALFPFDTGGYFEDRYSQWITRNKIREYEISGSLVAAKKFVQHFFFDNENYLIDSQNVAAPVSSTAHVEVSEYISMITTTGSDDDRRSSLEVQIKKVLGINDNNIYAIILPRAILSQPWVVDLANQIPNIKILSYFSIGNSRRSELFGACREVAMTFLKDNGYLT